MAAGTIYLPLKILMKKRLFLLPSLLQRRNAITVTAQNIMRKGMLTYMLSMTVTSIS